MPIISPVERSKIGWKTEVMSRRLIASRSISAAPDLGADGLSRDLVPRLLDAAIDRPFEAELRVVHDAPAADVGAEPAAHVRLLGQVAADQLVELRRLLLERARVIEHPVAGSDEEDVLVGANVRHAQGPGRRDAVGLESLQAADEVEEEVVVRLPAPDLLDASLRAGPEDQDGERAPLCAKFLSKIVGQGRDGREPRVRVVQARAFLLPLAAQGDELAVLARCHR